MEDIILTTIDNKYPGALIEFYEQTKQRTYVRFIYNATLYLAEVFNNGSMVKFYKLEDYVKC